MFLNTKIILYYLGIAYHVVVQTCFIQMRTILNEKIIKKK